MTARRLFSVLTVGLLASATLVAAQPAPKKPAPKTAPKAGKKGPLAPAKDTAAPAKGAAPAKDTAAGSVTGSFTGSVVSPISPAPTGSPVYSLKLPGGPSGEVRKGGRSPPPR